MSSFIHGGSRFEHCGAEAAASCWAELARAAYPSSLGPSLAEARGHDAALSDGARRGDAPVPGHTAGAEERPQLAAPPPVAPSLTGMEQRVIRLASLGCSLPEMAAILGRRLPTIDNHKTRAMRKLGVHKAAELTRMAIRLGLSPLDDHLTPQELQRLDHATPS